MDLRSGLAPRRLLGLQTRPSPERPTFQRLDNFVCLLTKILGLPDSFAASPNNSFHGTRLLAFLVQSEAKEGRKKLGAHTAWETCKTEAEIRAVPLQEFGEGWPVGDGKTIRKTRDTLFQQKELHKVK